MERTEILKGMLETLRGPGGLEFSYEVQERGAAGDGAAARLEVELAGPDGPRMVERNGELLHALESLGAAVLRLGPEEQEQLQFDAQGFKRERAEAVAQLAADAIAQVRETGKPYVFAPMNPRERRMLHMKLAESGLATASSGEGVRRFVVLYPQGMTPQPEQFAPSQGGGGGRGGPGRSGDGRSRDRGNFRGGSGGRGGGGGGRFGGQRRPGEWRGSRPAAGSAADRSEGDTGPVERVVLPGERLQRLDPNGNPIEERGPAQDGTAQTEAERLESLRRAFRKR